MKKLPWLLGTLTTVTVEGVEIQLTSDEQVYYRLDEIINHRGDIRFDGRGNSARRRAEVLDN